MSLALSLLSFTVCLGSLALCLLVFLQERARSPLNISYYVSAIAGALWAFGYTVIYQTQDQATALLFYRLSSIGWTVGIASAFLFTYYLFSSVVKRKPSVVVSVLTSLSAAGFWLAALRGRIFSNHFERTPAGWLEGADFSSPWVVAFSIWMVFISAMIIFFSILASRQTTLNRSRRMVRMVLVPSAFFGPVSVLTNLALPLSGSGWVPPLAPLVFGVLMISTGFAVLRYRMLSIEPGFIIESLFLEIADMVVLTDMDGVIRKTNHTLSNQPNLFPEPLVGKPVQTILPDLEIRGQVIYRAPQKLVVETRLRLPSGERVPVSAALSVVTDMHADPVGYFFLLHDLRDMRKIAQFAQELQENNRRLETLSQTDALTGIWNRSKFNEMLQSEHDRFKRYAEPFTLLLVDIDKFKLINDALGHLAGDEVLKNTVEQVKPEIRATDIFARWGGDEFGILLPHTDTPDAAQVAERVRAAVASVCADQMCVTASVGMATICRGEELAELFERADAAVYRAKEQGGNCFVLG
jgi:diguanylate cyclase (GGDEF)-like protein